MLWNQALGRVSAWWTGVFDPNRVGHPVWQRWEAPDGLVPGQRDIGRLGRRSEAMVFMGLCQAAVRPPIHPPGMLQESISAVFVLSRAGLP